MGTTELVYRFIYEYAMKHGGNTPSFAEISDGVDRSKSVAYHHVGKLLKSGKLTRIDNKIVVTILADMLQVIGDVDGPDWYSEESA